LRFPSPRPIPGRRDRGRGDYIAAASCGFRRKEPALSAGTDLSRVHHQWIIQPLDECLRDCRSGVRTFPGRTHTSDLSRKPAEIRYNECQRMVFNNWRSSAGWRSIKPANAAAWARCCSHGHCAWPTSNTAHSSHADHGGLDGINGLIASSHEGAAKMPRCTSARLRPQAHSEKARNSTSIAPTACGQFQNGSWLPVRSMAHRDSERAAGKRFGSGFLTRE